RSARPTGSRRGDAPATGLPAAVPRPAAPATRDGAQRADTTVNVEVWSCWPTPPRPARPPSDRKSTRLNSSHSQNSYAVFRLKKKLGHNLDMIAKGRMQPVGVFQEHAHVGAALQEKA